MRSSALSSSSAAGTHCQRLFAVAPRIRCSPWQGPGKGWLLLRLPPCPGPLPTGEGCAALGKSPLLSGSRRKTWVKPSVSCGVGTLLCSGCRCARDELAAAGTRLVEREPGEGCCDAQCDRDNGMQILRRGGGHCSAKRCHLLWCSPTLLSCWGLLGADPGRVRDTGRCLLAAWSPPGWMDGGSDVLSFVQVENQCVEEEINGSG